MGGGGYYAATLTGSNRIRSIEITPDGDYLLAGYQDSGPLGGTDGFVVKMSPDGTILWQKNIGNSSNNQAVATVDTSGNIYVGVTYTGTNEQINLMKLDSNGTLVSQVNFNKVDTRPSEFINRMIWGKDNNLYVMGWGFSGNIYAPQSFILKVNSSLSRVWGRQWNNNRDSFCGVLGAGIDPSGNVYCAVSNNYAVTAQDPGLAKLNSSGTQQWHKVRYYSGTNDGISENSFDAIIDNSNEPIHIHTGAYWTVGQAYNVRKLNSSGTEQWVTAISNNEFNGGSIGALAVDANNDIYALVRRSSTFLVKLNTSGTVLWKRDILNFSGENLRVDLNGDVVVTGFAFGQPAIVKMAADGSTIGSAALPGGTITLQISTQGAGVTSNAIKDGSAVTSVDPGTAAGSLTVQNLSKSVELAGF